MRLPFRLAPAGDAEIVLAQRAMPVSADVFDARAPKLQDAAPRSGADRHAQAAQAHTAAISLVPDDQVERSGGEEEPKHEGKVAEKIEPALTERRKFVRFRRENPGYHQQQAPKHTPRGDQLGCKPAPVAHTR